MKLFKVWIICFLAVILLALNFSMAETEAEDLIKTDDGDWELVWSDEFDGDEIDMDNWSFDHPENGRYNQEIQSYTEDNAWIEDGQLVIEAREEEITEPNGETFDYTSSKLITQGKQTWTYGKFEIKAKLPEGQGMWPAIWMMPDDEPFYGTWPVGGEIDIMELLGHRPHEVHANIHYGEPHGDESKTYTLPDGQTFSDDFHLFTLEWEPGEIRWYIDNELYHTANDWFSKHPSNADHFAYPAPFDQDFFLILNISVGGGWPGNPDDTTPLPQQMLVDYVRVYQKDEYPVREAPESPGEGESRPPLEDGNYIYNGDFSSETDFWEYLTDGGDADLDVEDGELHISITEGGNQEHSVQFLQTPVPLEVGALYKASFSARAGEERPLNVKVGGDGSRGWADYANEDPVNLSTDWDDYEFEFIMEERTDLAARFEFNMGLNDADVWLRDIRLEKLEDGPDTQDPDYEPRSPLPSGNYIYNGTFDQGNNRLSFWQFKTDDHVEATYYIGSAVDERRFDLLIEDSDDQAESIQLVQPQVNLEQGNSYQLNFDASADEARSIEVSFVSANGNIVADQTVDLSAETDNYSVDFDVDVVTDNNVELRFNMGGSNENVYLDNVELERVLASDGVENNLISNGVFDSLAYWSTENNHSTAEFGVGADGFNVNITDAGYDTWAIQLYQSGVHLEQGETYEVSIDAKSTVDRPILFHIENETDYTDYFATTLELVEEWTTYDFEFTMEEDTDPNAKFGFSFGGENADVDFRYVDHDISINNVLLTKVEDTDDGGETDPIDEDDEQALLDRINDLRDRIEELENSSDGEDLENQLSNLENELNALQTQFNELENQLPEIEQQLTALEEAVAELRATLADQDDDLEGDSTLENEEDEATVDGEDESEGEVLPATATDSFNLMLMGVITLVTGMTIILIRKKIVVNK